MNKKIVLVAFGIIVMIVLGVIATEAMRYRIVYLDCMEAKTVIKARNEVHSLQMKDYFAGMDKSRLDMDKFIALIETKGVNMDSMKEKLVVLDNKANLFKSDYKEFKEKLDELGDNSCNREELDRVSKELDKLIEKMREDSKDLENYLPVITEEVNKILSVTEGK
ncbi:MAG: hypothetical protein WC867_05970 [Candidatus Pacearchaeota archaeon]|jgi:hypothetical protein